mgnify:CR=1 FL=1
MKDGQQKPQDLIVLLKGHKTYIQTHNFPDPDAIASAYGLQYFLQQFLLYTQVSAGQGIQLKLPDLHPQPVQAEYEADADGFLHGNIACRLVGRYAGIRLYCDGGRAEVQY